MKKTVSSYETVNTTYVAIEAVTQDNYVTKKKNVQEIQKITYSLPNGLYIFVEHLRKNLYPPPRAHPAAEQPAPHFQPIKRNTNSINRQNCPTANVIVLSS